MVKITGSYARKKTLQRKMTTLTCSVSHNSVASCCIVFTKGVKSKLDMVGNYIIT